MKLSAAQLRALEALDEYLRGASRPCSDAGFFRSVSRGRKAYIGPPVSGEEAYFLRTDRGFDIRPEQVNGWERYKELVIGHRMRTITVKEIAEDVPIGIVSWPELYADRPFLCNSVRHAVGLNDYQPDSATIVP